MAAQANHSTRQRDSVGIPAPVLSAGAGEAYDRAAWEEECFVSFAEGRDPSACPDCGRTGFYGPRVASGDRQFRQCRFCGFHQDVNHEATKAHPTVHGCRDWPETARAPYIWWMAPDEDHFNCPFCGEVAHLDDSRTTAPIDDPDHPWWRIPQARTRFYYTRLWENWPFTKGRTFL